MYCGETVLLDGKPLPLVTRAGVRDWIENNVAVNFHYDQVRDPLDGKLKYRCLYRLSGAVVPYVLVDDEKVGAGMPVVLFDEEPDGLAI